MALVSVTDVAPDRNCSLEIPDGKAIRKKLRNRDKLGICPRENAQGANNDGKQAVPLFITSRKKNEENLRPMSEENSPARDIFNLTVN